MIPHPLMPDFLTCCLVFLDKGEKIIVLFRLCALKIPQQLENVKSRQELSPFKKCKSYHKNIFIRYPREDAFVGQKLSTKTYLWHVTGKTCLVNSYQEAAAFFGQKAILKNIYDITGKTSLVNTYQQEAAFVDHIHKNIFMTYNWQGKLV